MYVILGCMLLLCRVLCGVECVIWCGVIVCYYVMAVCYIGLDVNVILLGVACHMGWMCHMWWGCRCCRELYMSKSEIRH